MSRPLLLAGGTLVDGTGAPARRADVLVADGRVVAVGDLLVEARARDAEVVDLDGLVVTPGFVDIHTHSDVSLVHDPAGESKVRQGVTTEVIGNCGFSPFPHAEDRLDLHRDHMARLGEPPMTPDWLDLDGYACRLAARPPALNVAALVGHGTLRVAVVGVEERETTSAERARMRALLADALAAGAFGLTTGLTHVPSSYGGPDEVVDLLAPVAEAGAMYATHARATAGAELDAVREAITAARRSGARLQYSHVALNEPSSWGRAQESLALFDEAAASGLDVAFDLYPYAASSSSLSQYLPGWVQEGGSEAMAARLGDPTTWQRAVAETARGWYGGIPWLWDRVRIADAPEPGLAGRTLEDVAGATGRDPVELVLDLCRRHGNEVEVVLSYRVEEDVQAFLAHPFASIGSDGNAIAVQQESRRPHPRHFGTFPRVLARYVRELGVLTLEDAVRKMTSANARRLGLTDRGRVAEGMVADLVALDADRVQDLATFDEPCAAPVGIEHVWVSGVATVRDGVQTEARPGRLLRRSTTGTH